MRYWAATLVGLALCLAGILVMCWSIYELVHIGTCASGGPYVSARPCPPGTEWKILSIFGAIALMGAGLGVYALRGGGLKSAGASIGLGIVMWSMLFLSIAFAGLVSAFGPASPDAPGAKLGIGIVAVIFIPMGLLPLIGALTWRRGRNRLQAKMAQGATTSAFGSTTPPPTVTPRAPIRPTPTPTAPATGAAASGDRIERLRKLGELRDKGILTEEEFQREKAEILRGL